MINNELYNRHIVLSQNEIQKCKSFAEKFASAKAEKSGLDFGSITHMSRDLVDKTADTMTGKLTEVAFSRFCKLKGFEIEIDFDIYEGRLNIDNGQDIVSFQGKKNNIKCDIKGAKHIAQWLLVEQHKINEKLIYSDLYIFVKLTLPQGVEKNLNLFNQNKIESEIVGYAFKEDFFDSENTPWFHYKEGQSPLTGYFAKQIINNTLRNIGEINILKKHDLIKSYKMIKGNVDPSRHFLKMKQKAAHNYGLPIDYLRSSETEFDFLFDLLSNQRISKSPKPIFHKR
jgi:hypothetical protein